MDISVLFISHPANVVIADPQKNAAKYASGDIVGVYDYNPAIIPDPNGIFSVAHITGIPDGFVTLEQIQAVVMAPVTAGNTMVRLRRWRIPVENMTPPERSAVLNDRVLTTTWAKFKKYTRYKEIADWLDPVQDNETRELSEIDFA